MTPIYEATMKATGIDPSKVVALPQGNVPMTKRERHRRNRDAARVLRKAGFTE